MLRPLLRLRNEVFDAFGPVKSSPTSKNVRKGSRAYNSSSSLEKKKTNRSTLRNNTRDEEETHLELDSNFTESLTCCRVGLEPEGASLLPPDAAAYDNPTVLRSVPRARYSVLMALPRIVLGMSVNPSTIKH